MSWFQETVKKVKEVSNPKNLNPYHAIKTIGTGATDGLTEIQGGQDNLKLPGGATMESMTATMQPLAEKAKANREAYDTETEAGLGDLGKLGSTTLNPETNRLPADLVMGLRGDLGAGTPVGAKTVTADKYSMGKAGNALVNRATATGESPWLTMSLQKNAQAQQDAVGNAVNAGMGQAAAGRSALAMKGGLTGGSAERLAKSSARDINASRAGIARTGMSEATNLRLGDEETKMGLLGQAAGLETNIGMGNASNKLTAETGNANRLLSADTTNAGNRIDVGKFNRTLNFQTDAANIDNTLGAQSRADDMRLNVFKQRMAKSGAELNADAIQNSGKK